MQGIKRAIIYGLVPHKLGFCGPKTKATELFLNYLKGRVDEKEIRLILRKFEGAYPYYELIARSNGINDPLDERVVEAYWIGNELLDYVAVDALKEMIRTKFSRPGLLPEAVAAEKAQAVPAGSGR